MKYLLFFMFPMLVFGQSIAIGHEESSPHPSAILDVQSTDKGILIPRGDTALVADPAEGLMLYHTQDQSFYYYEGKWKKMNAGGTEVPRGSLILSRENPAEELLAAGFELIGSYDQTYTDRREDSINYGVWESISNEASADLIGDRGWWTGSELMIWGGNKFGDYSNAGARYNPSTNTWMNMSMVNAPSPRYGFAAAWTGTKLIVFGGRSAGGYVNDLFEYNPATDSWSEIADMDPPSARIVYRDDWTGDELIFWGGQTIGGQTNEGFIYHVANNSWTAMSTVGAPQPMNEPGLVYLNGRLLIIGGHEFSGYPSCSTLNVPQYYYDLATDSWESLQTTTAREGDIGLAIGDKAFFAGGRKRRRIGQSNGGIIGGGSCNPTSSFLLGLFGRYNADTDDWSPPTVNSFPQPVGSANLVDAGGQLIHWGVNAGGSPLGQRIDPITGENSIMSMIGGPAHSGFISVWTGSRMMCWAPGQDLYFYDPAQKGENPFPAVFTETIYMYQK